mgnify:CR=1 FL=1
MKRSCIILAGCALGVVGCQPPPPPPPQLVRIEAVGDPGERVRDVEVVVNGQVIARTNQTGIATAHLNGAEGVIHQAEIRCPEDRYTSPKQPLLIQKATLRDPKSSPLYEVHCTRRTHMLVVALRVKDGANLPVNYLGGEVARLDASGAGNIAFQLNQEDTLELTLDTSGRPELLPRSPTLPTRAKNSDDLVVVDFAFVEKKKPKAKRTSALRPTQI